MKTNGPRTTGEGRSDGSTRGLLRLVMAFAIIIALGSASMLGWAWWRMNSAQSTIDEITETCGGCCHTDVDPVTDIKKIRIRARARLEKQKRVNAQKASSKDAGK